MCIIFIYRKCYENQDGISISEYAEEFTKAVMEEYIKRQGVMTNDKEKINDRIKEIRVTARLITDKIKVLNSETAIKYMEEDLISLEKEIVQLEEEKMKAEPEKIDMIELKEIVKYFLEHLEFLLLGQANPVRRATFFSLIFQVAPTYQELISGTPRLEPFIKLNEEFKQSKYQMVSHTGLEPDRPYNSHSTSL